MNLSLGKEEESFGDYELLFMLCVWSTQSYCFAFKKKNIPSL